MNPDLVEAVARAIGGVTRAVMDDEKSPSRAIAMLEAKAALKAHEEWLASQGLVIRPQVATTEMCKAGEPFTGLGYADNCWQAMVNAKQPPETPHSPAESEACVQK